jgi:hypothetical protein
VVNVDLLQGSCRLRCVVMYFLWCCFNCKLRYSVVKVLVADSGLEDVGLIPGRTEIFSTDSGPHPAGCRK